ncbi:MAG: hypothetical protein A3H91_08020 [Gammaproteobacteria bacterium RIFCSPLOWO2_02_FULL_61_13]|nr:MAG: hypothetical protein A3H91_08020 [Gammaproteobacteria bacterium RIFCSPLOWO2_02_FULL_61_13]
MDQHRFGEVSVARIPEREPMREPMFKFFPEMPEEVVAANEHWLAPLHYHPESRSMLLHFHSWLVRTRHHTILVDTCNGNHKPRPGLAMSDALNSPFLENLRHAGVAPEDIDFVMCTHLHPDHVGWNTRLHDGRWVPTFPNAKYLMSRIEHDACARLAEDGAKPQWARNIYQDSVLPVVEAGLARLLEGSHAVDDNFTIHPAPGHTMGTCRADLESNGDGAIFCGDILHTPLQVEHWQIASRTCEDKPLSVKSRHALLAACAERQALLLPMHFGPPYASYVKSSSTGFALDWNIAG